MKKKTIIGICVLLLLSSFAFAATDYSPDNKVYAMSGEVYRPVSSRMAAMGGAGLGISGYSDSFIANPANLGDHKFTLTLPSIGITVFNPKKMIDSGVFSSLRDYMDSKDSSDLVTAGTKWLGTLTKGRNEVERIDAGFSLSAGIFGLSFGLQERLYGTLDSNDSTSGNYVGETTANLTLGLGWRFRLGQDSGFTLDIGANASFVYRAYTESMTYTKVIDIIDGADFMKTTKLASGYSIPLSFGVNVNMPLGFRVSGVLRNINGRTKFKLNNSIDDWKDNPDIFGTGEYEYDDGIKLDAGVTWNAPLGKVSRFVQPVIAVDMVDVMNINDSQPFLAHLYLGAQVKLLQFLELRYGLSQGYQSIGVGFDLWALSFDISYWKRSYGENFLDNDMDALTLRFTLGSN